MVTFSDCNKVEVSHTVHVTHESTITEGYVSIEITIITHSDCKDLSVHYLALVDGEKSTVSEKAQLYKYIVDPGKCGSAISRFIYTKGFEFAPYPPHTRCRL